MTVRRSPAQPGDQQRSVAAGEVVFRQGDHAMDMFVIQSGRVEISRGSGADRQVMATLSDRQVMATLGPGDFFGEMSLLEALPREADATAITPGELLVITQGGLLVRLRRDPTFAVEMLHKLSGRIRALNAHLESPEPR